MAEWRMLSPRLAFMQIRKAVVGKQLRIHGNIVCVPADVCTTVSTLPRTSSNFETVAVELKRRSQYQYAFLTSNVRPACIREVGTYLVEHGDLFQLQNITFNHSELETIEPDTLLTVSDASDNGAVTDDTVTTNVSTSVSSEIHWQQLTLPQAVIHGLKLQTCILIQQTFLIHYFLHLILLKIQNEQLFMAKLTQVTLITFTLLHPLKVTNQSV